MSASMVEWRTLSPSKMMVDCCSYGAVGGASRVVPKYV